MSKCTGDLNKILLIFSILSILCVCKNWNIPVSRTHFTMTIKCGITSYKKLPPGPAQKSNMNGILSKNAGAEPSAQAARKGEEATEERSKVHRRSCPGAHDFSIFEPNLIETAGAPMQINGQLYETYARSLLIFGNAFLL